MEFPIIVKIKRQQDLDCLGGCSESITYCSADTKITFRANSIVVYGTGVHLTIGRNQIESFQAFWRNSNA